MSGSAQRLFEVTDATWPAARCLRQGPWTLREGQGGGKRVSAATAEGPVTLADIDAADAAMLAMGQTPLFMLRPGDAALDAQLAERGYGIVDPVVIYSCPAAHLADRALPRVTVFTLWEPLAIMREIWLAGGIGPNRVAVMERAAPPKTGMLARHRDQPAGAAFAAVHDRIAMVHAIEIVPHQRRQGMGGWIMRAAAIWASEQGADTIAVLCTRANAGANALYASLGMEVVGQYHYRMKPDQKDPT